MKEERELEEMYAVDPNKLLNKRRIKSKLSGRIKRHADMVSRQQVLREKEAGPLPTTDVVSPSPQAEESGRASPIHEAEPEKTAEAEVEEAETLVGRTSRGQKQGRDASSEVEEPASKRPASEAPPPPTSSSLSSEEIDALCQEFSGVAVMRSLDLSARSGPMLRLGRPVLHRALNADLLEELTSTPHTYGHLAERKGLIISELATIAEHEARQWSGVSKKMSDFEDKAARAQLRCGRAVELANKYKDEARYVLAEKNKFEKMVDAADEKLKAVSVRAEEEAKALRDEAKALKEEVEREREAAAILSKEKEDAEVRYQQLEESIPAREKAAVLAFKKNEMSSIVNKQVVSIYLEGYTHAVRQAMIDPDVDVPIEKWARLLLNDAYSIETRAAHAQVPYSDQSLKLIARDDAENQRSAWVAPAVDPDNFHVLVERVREEFGDEEEDDEDEQDGSDK